MENARIQLQNVSKFYYSETSVTQALRKVNLSFQMGEFVAITGESGSGKSTLLNIISGIDSFDEGEMLVGGEPTFQYDGDDWEEYRRNEIGYVFQDYSLIGHYSAKDNIVSALLIMGLTREQAVQKAESYLEQVGLKGFGDQRASELSSGQKQRLSIARALAKDTEIIVADEPTGNLDSETGNQIIRLLKKLSKDHLVIMVTHNYDQVEDYVTRKIRLHDGEVVLDVPVNKAEIAAESEESQDMKSNSGISRKQGRRTWWEQNGVAVLFAGMNAGTQKGRAALFTVFFLITGVVSFLFLGELFIHSDDYSTRDYSDSAFYHQDDTRLSVKHSDGSVITAKDREKISRVKNVVEVDQYDFANDVNYYIEEDRDYKYVYAARANDSEEEQKSVEFLKEDRFMKSSSCISKEELKVGRLPEKSNEIVLYAEDEKVLDSEKLCYFTAKNIWGKGEYYQNEYRVVGLLKERTDQVYFSPELCQMLTMQLDGGQYVLHYYYVMEKGDYIGKTTFIPVINEELKENQVRISDHFIVPSGNISGGMGGLPSEKEEALAGSCLLRIRQYDENGSLEAEAAEEEVQVGDTYHLSSGIFLEVSRELYQRYYDRESYQAAVYINSYAKTDRVIRSLEKQGYDAVSTYRVSTTEYIPEKVMDRLVLLGISVFVLLMLVMAEVLILRSLMKIRVKDYFVMKFMGMKMNMIGKISYYEMAGYCALAVVLTIGIMMGLAGIGIPMLREMIYYYDFKAFVIFIAYNFLLEVLTVASFNRLLKGRIDG